jgi:hypothetical protein
VSISNAENEISHGPLGSWPLQIFHVMIQIVPIHKHCLYSMTKMDFIKLDHVPWGVNFVQASWQIKHATF